MKNACVVGYGAIGPVHSEVLSKSGYADLYAICDIIPERADEGAKKYGVKALYSFDDVLADENIEVVHICTPHYLHVQMAIKALEAGKHIVLEKPVGMLLSEIDELEAIYKKTDKKACIMLQNRTNNGMVKMKELIENDKTLGKMLGLSGFITWSRDDGYYKSEEWRGKWATEGGGLLINQAIHMVDMLNWIGGGIKSLKSSISNKLINTIEVEDTADALFVLNNSVRGVFYASNAHSVNSPFLVEAAFENALLRYADSRLYRITEENCEVLAYDNRAEIGKKYWGNGHANVINKFYYSLENGGDDYIDLTEGLHSARVMLSMYGDKKVERKEWIKL